MERSRLQRLSCAPFLPRSRRQRGFTVVELFVVIIVIATIAFILLPSIGHTHHHGARPMKDGTQVRGIQQAMVVWAGNNKDVYPLPSVIDADNKTVKELGPCKDTTANIMSLLVFNNGISPELLISTAEANTAAVSLYDQYEYDEPSGAVDPAGALWDPGLRAGLSAEDPGHISYVHMLPFGPRLEQWKTTFSATEAVVGNRGPEIASVGVDKRGRVTPKVVNPDTYTFLIHGSRTRWEGNIAYNDGHTNFENELAPERLTFQCDEKARRDVLFFDEPDDTAGKNAFLGLFKTAGPERKDWRPIWD